MFSFHFTDTQRRFTLKIHHDLRADSSVSLRVRFTPQQPRLLSPRPGQADKFTYDIKTPYIATILVNEELHTSLSDRSCRHVELKIDPVAHPSLAYVPGDHLGVYPQNSRELVDRIMKRLGVTNPQQVYSLSSHTHNTHTHSLSPYFCLLFVYSGVLTFSQVISLVPIDEGSGDGFGPVTVETAFLYFVDITNPPRQAFLKALAEYASDPKEKAHLLHLCSPEGQVPLELFHFFPP